MKTQVTRQARRFGLMLIVVCFIGVTLTGCTTPTPPPLPPQPTTPSLPDLVLLDIILKSGPQAGDHQDEVIINTVVQNQGVNATQGFNVWCEFRCREEPNWSPTYFSGMNLPNGLGSGQTVTLGDDSWLSLSDCPFRGSRTFTCEVDKENYVQESNETNNTLQEVLMTGR